MRQDSIISTVHWLSQKKLAEQLGVDQSTLGGRESGEHQPGEKLAINFKILENILRERHKTLPPTDVIRHGILRQIPL